MFVPKSTISLISSFGIYFGSKWWSDSINDIFFKHLVSYLGGLLLMAVLISLNFKLEPRD